MIADGDTVIPEFCSATSAWARESPPAGGTSAGLAVGLVKVEKEDASGSIGGGEDVSRDEARAGE
jgi:hypothetical protein